MKINTGNFILGVILSIVVLFMIGWIVGIQTKKDVPDLTDKIIERENLMKSIQRGSNLFQKESCISCHKPNTRQRPDIALRNISKRRSKEFLFQFIRDEQLMIKNKNSEVIALKEEWNWANGLHNKKHLKDSQIQDILNYLDAF